MSNVTMPVQQVQKSISVLPITPAGQPREALASSIIDGLRGILHETQGELPQGLKSALIAALPLLEGPAGPQIQELRHAFPQAFHDPITSRRIVRSAPGDHALAPSRSDLERPRTIMVDQLLKMENKN
jgi:hypothetical protein